ncbi:DsbA family oxidoreductase [Chromatiaceae bacterium AAb-1]|nr:DsbA family oxidoreductase [Chromatiaceae bacterium AAb-1]
MKTLKIDIVSDIACPWCAIGYARLEKAMQALSSELQFDIEWHAFELDPNPSSPQLPILTALSQKYGKTEEEMRQSQQHLISLATGLGINFSAMQQRKTSNTFNAHRLVKWAATQGKATAMKKALFNACFGEAADMSATDVLSRCAEAAGLNGEEAATILASEQFVNAVREDEAQYQQAGISSVPAFIINQRYLISGAQEPESFINALQQIAAETA